MTIVGVRVPLTIAGEKKNATAELPVGLEIRGEKDPYFWHGDFDGDGVQDTLYAVRVTSQYQADSGPIPLSLGTSEPLGSEEPLALLIQSSQKHKSYLLHRRSYFDSPIWREVTLPVGVVRANDAEYRGWKTAVRPLQGDGIILGTEAGIDTLVYWDGLLFRWYQPPEQP
ncbi:MAG TPA: hypothetical protein V6D19_26150 [Stenomitos sp.]